MSTRRSSAPRSRQRTQSTPLNRLLAALPRVDRERLVPAMDVVPLKARALIYKPGKAVQYVYFPGGGFCSIVTVLADGRMVEVATVGREGMVGVSALVVAQSSTSATMVQGEGGSCYRMPVKAFRSEMKARGAFYALMTRYIDAHIGVVMQSAACNAVHSIEQRLARWLLMAHDRMATQEFMLTQEFAAMMLGAARPTVTVVAGTLQRAGLITYRRGRVTIVNRKRLEAASCECYEAATRLLQSVTAAPRR